MEEWKRAFSRALLVGPPNSWKTSSLATWPRPMVIVSYPGEKGTGAIPQGDGIKAFVWRVDEVTQGSVQAVAEIEALTTNILAGKYGQIQTFAGDGIHKLYCPTPDQRILTADFRWVPAGDLQVGDSLIAFNEKRNFMERRKYHPATVTHHGFRREPAYRVLMSDGSALRCTGEHPWLYFRKTGSASQVQDWRITSKLRVGNTIPKFFDPWNVDVTIDGGWLSGLFDGEGSLGRYEDARGHWSQLHLGLAQKPGAVLDKAKDILTRMEIPFGVYEGAGGCCHLQIWGKAAIVRVLGSIRPIRLLPKCHPTFLGALTARNRHTTVVAIEPIGEQEIVELSTSTETYICEGFGCHNSNFLDMVTGGDLSRGEDFEAKLYNRSHERFMGYINRITQSKIPRVVFTCWEGRELDDPDNSSTKAPRHIFPDLPGKMAKRIMGEFGCVLYADPGQMIAPGKMSQGTWQTRPMDKVWGAGMKLPVEIAKKIPDRVPQDWQAFEAMVFKDA